MSIRVITKKNGQTTDTDVLFRHNLLHHIFKKLARGSTYGDWTRDTVTLTHQKLVEEFRTRKIPHHIKDVLDNTLKLSSSNFFEVLREFRVRSPFISIVGGFANWGASRGDIDFMLGTSFEGNIVATRTIDVLAERAGEFTLHISDSKYVTPFSNFIPLYNLKLKFCDSLELKRSAPVFPHEHKRTYRSISEFMSNIGDEDIVLFDDFVNFMPIGSSNHIEQIDVYFSVELPREMALPIEFRIFRQFPQEHWKKFRFCYKEPPDDAIPFYSLVLERINKGGEVFEMSIPPISEKQASLSVRENKIEFGRYFYPLKTSLSPLHAYRKAELFSVESAVQYLRRVAQRSIPDQEVPIVFVEKKYDGLRCIISRNGDDVKIFTDSGLDKTWRFPTLIRELRAMTTPQKFIIDSECEGWINGKHQDREVISGYVNASSSPDDSHVVFNVFDILAFNGIGPATLFDEIEAFQKEGLPGWREKFARYYYEAPTGSMQSLQLEDMHEFPMQLRRKILTQLPFKQSVVDIPDPNKSHLNLVVSTRCAVPDILRRALQNSSDALSSEGAMIKSYDGIYPLRGVTTEWAKLKKEIELKVIVWRKLPTAKKGVFTYDIALEFTPSDNVNKKRVVTVGKKEYLHIGRTYNTETDVPPGSIIKIKFYNLNLYEDERTLQRYLNVYGASLFETRGPDDYPDTVLEAIEIGRSTGLLHEKKTKTLEVQVEE